MTTESAPAEPVRKELRLRCSREHAFDVFARRMNDWWPSASHSVSGAEVARVDIEGRVGGRVFETRRDGEELAWGQVVCWEPPERLAFTWHPGAAASQATTVTVTFHDDDDGTRVCLEHVGWSVYGDGATAKRDAYDSGWSKVLDVMMGLVNSGRTSMGGVARMPMVALTSGALTLVLFRMMAALVAVGNAGWVDPPKPAPIEVGRIHAETPPPINRPALPDRQEPQRPPAPPRRSPTETWDPPGWDPSGHAAYGEVPSIDETIFDGPNHPRLARRDTAGSGGADVPSPAAERGIEGWGAERIPPAAAARSSTPRSQTLRGCAAGRRRCR